MMGISEASESRPDQDSKIKLNCPPSVLILPSSSNLKRSFQNILSDSLPTSYVFAAGIKHLCSPKVLTPGELKA